MCPWTHLELHSHVFRKHNTFTRLAEGVMCKVKPLGHGLYQNKGPHKVELNMGLIIAAKGFIELNDHSVDWLIYLLFSLYLVGITVRKKKLLRTSKIECPLQHTFCFLKCCMNSGRKNVLCKVRCTPIALNKTVQVFTFFYTHCFQNNQNHWFYFFDSPQQRRWASPPIQVKVEGPSCNAS